MRPSHPERLQSVSLLLFFVFCQVIGTMCVIPDVGIASEGVFLVEESMACPMEAVTMCPPSLTSSPERELKDGPSTSISHTTIVVNPVLESDVPSVLALWSWSSVLSIVPLSIVASSVLRI